MMIIPTVKKPHPDELLYSYICRLADMNSLPVTAFVTNYAGGKTYRSGDLPVDVREEFLSIYGNMHSEMLGCMKNLYLQLSTYRFESMVMTSGRQTAYINNVFRPKDGLNVPTNRLFTVIRICPECMKEDAERYGKPYIHRSHQLSGVCTCHKHGCRLLSYHGKAGHEYDFRMEDYGEVPAKASEESLTAYTGYVQALSDACLDADIRSVKGAVFRKLKSLGYQGTGGYAVFSRDFSAWEHSALSPVTDMDHFLKVKMVNACGCSMEEIIPVLMFLYPDAVELIQQLQGHEAVLEEYTCPVCGREYCQTPAAHRDGWGCPYCESGMSVQERYARLVNTMGRGMYQPLEEFRSIDEEMLMCHTTCGKDIRIKPREFLFEEQRCSCEHAISFDAAKEEVESHDGFKLISFSGTDKPARIYHEQCGQEFTCRYRKFLQYPECRECNPPSMTAALYRKRVKALVGNEYTVVRGFKDQHTKVAIRHNKCRCVQEYKPSAFLDGQRCRKCGKLLKHKDLEKMLETYSNGRYIITEYGRNLCTVKDTKTENLIRLSSKKIVQEIQRPTPSPILPPDEKHH